MGRLFCMHPALCNACVCHRVSDRPRNLLLFRYIFKPATL